MTRPPPRSPRTDPLFPYPTLFRALLPAVLLAVPIGVVAACVTNLFRLSIDYLDTAMLGFPADITVHFAQLDWYWRLLVPALGGRSEEHTSELQSLMRISYAVFCLKTKKQTTSHELLYSLHHT